MDVLKMLEIIYKAYEPTRLNNLIYQNVNSRESFKGILIESYGRSLFCDKLITPFGMLQVASGGTTQELKEVETYIKSRIRYIKLLDILDTKYYACVGPFYLVTHIDDVPVSHDSVEGLTYETYPAFVKYLSEGLEYQIFAEMLCDDTLFHIFGLLLRKKMIVF